ncbi:gluconokinase [Methylobrevis pamukkalensis]|uniref:Gluconokinase n=1 Tax=Methylobrevis pamukkalensis TaxID=1439726 RepID=A0A1E3GZQ9_9HYPH|nr:gluconokinase [Methylobrevis pamukkalensis]ODN69530.1 Thermoresistant gluconokinase [Methylobrevis pamukkalensis]
MAADERPGPAGGDVIVVMGVSGCGKTTVAEALAARLGGSYLEADRLHLPASVARMAAGIPLTDEDRWPWLEAVAAAAAEARPRPVVVACSALRRAYRDLLRARLGPVRFVHLAGSRETIAARLAGRSAHFFDPALLDSQFATLEPPGTDEDAVTLDVTLPPARLVDEALAALASPAPAGP